MNKIKLNEQIFQLRKEKGVTQEELAGVLGVTNQAVSKWEAGTCCPDVQLLPELAHYFHVSMDVLFGMEKTNTVTGEWKISEFEEKIAQENARLKDYLAYAELLDKIAWDYIEKAKNAYLKVMSMSGTGHAPEYYRVQKKWVQMQGRLGRGEVCIGQYIKQLEEDASVCWNYYILAFAYKETDKIQESWDVLKVALEKFDEDASLFELAGDVCRVRECYNDAIEYWTKAFELNSDNPSPLYSKAYLYEKLGCFEKAVCMWEMVIRWSHEHGQDEKHELDWPLVKIESLNHMITEKANKQMIK